MRRSAQKAGWNAQLFCESIRRSSSPYINHFLQPDSIIPDLSNPQSWNRYSYTLNNPVRYYDPTGHWVFETDDPIQEKLKIAQKDAKERRDRREKENDKLETNDPPVDYKPCDWAGLNNAFCSVPATMFDFAALGLDALSLLISTVELGTADAVWLGAIGISIFFPASAPELLIGAAQFDVEVSGALGAVENPMGLWSTGFTAASDWLKGNTYISSDGDLYVGQSTLASAATTAVGFIPEANVDFVASAYIFNVDMEGIGSRTAASVNVSKPVHDFLVSFFSN